MKIGLIGGFSAGKTSIAAAWMGKFEANSMNISHQESSDAVKVYDIDDSCVLIDTPGLFGFKEKYNTNTAQIEKYKDITKKYISEAHLVLYVMNSDNPIKASHQEDLQWLFRSLNILPRTVFVLSRFDDVVDIEDDSDYAEQVKIKEQNVRERLCDLISLTENEMNDLSIVAVSANPYDEGFAYWLENMDKFKAISHIDNLQRATLNKIKTNGGQMEIALAVQKSITHDVLHQQLPDAIKKDSEIGVNLDRLSEVRAVLRKKVDSCSLRIIEARKNLRDFIAKYFSDLILQLDGLDIQTFNAFLEREIGNNGVMMDSKIRSEFEEQVSSLSTQLSQVKSDFESEVRHYNNTVEVMGKQGLDYVIKGKKIVNGKSVLVARDGIVSVANVVGVDLAKMLKFKPWGAVNLAKGVNGALAALGLVLELWDTWKTHERKKEFQQAINKYKESFNMQREELLALINGEDFIPTFFPEVKQLNLEFAELDRSIAELNVKRIKFNEWRKEGEIIEAELIASSNY